MFVCQLGTWLRLGMEKTTGCATLEQGTGGTLDAHAMAGKHKSVLLQVVGLTQGVCPVLAQEFSKVAHRAQPTLEGA